MSRRRILGVAGRVLAGFLALSAVVLVGPVLYVQFDDSVVPPGADVPALPDGATIARQGTQCASGGCWRELLVVPPDGQSPEAFMAQHGLDHERCQRRGLLDRRVVCVGADVAGSSQVLLYVQFDHWLKRP